MKWKIYLTFLSFLIIDIILFFFVFEIIIEISMFIFIDFYMNFID